MLIVSRLIPDSRPIADSQDRTYRKRSRLIICAVAVAVVDGLNVAAIAGGGQSVSLAVGTIAISTGFSIVGLRAGFSSLSTTNEGIRVVNAFSSFALRWSEIERFEIGRWKLLPYVCLIHLKDGSTMHAGGIQESTRFKDFSAKDIVDGLNARLTRT